MIAVDTNVFVRIFVDDPSQPEQVSAARTRAAEVGKVYVPQIVQIESVWVFSKAFKLARGEVELILHHVRNNSAFVLQRPEVFSDALDLYRESNLEFSDCVILQECRLQGVVMWTFDRKLARQSEAEVLPI